MCVCVYAYRQQRWSHSVELDSRSFHATLTKLEQEFQVCTYVRPTLPGTRCTHYMHMDTTSCKTQSFVP